MKIKLVFALLLSLLQISKAQNQEWLIFSKNKNSFPSNNISSIKIDSRKNFWIGTMDSGLVKLDLSKGISSLSWTVYNIPRNNFPSNTIYSITADNLNNLWITSGNGLIKLSESKIDHNNFNIPIDFLCIAIDSIGNKWIGTGNPLFQIGAGLIKYDNALPVIYNKSNSGLPSDFVSALLIDKHNKKWIGTNKGLAVYDDSNWILYNSANTNLPSDFIYFIFVDSKNNLWIGTGYALIVDNKAGLVKYANNSWTIYYVSSGLPVNYVTCAAEDKFGNLWFGTWGGGLVKYDGTNWKVYNSSNSQLPNNVILSIAIDYNDNKWIGTYGGGLAIYRENGVIISVEENYLSLPKFYELKQNYPNPFNPETIIEFSIPEQTHVKLKIYDILGREITTLIDKELNPGNYKKVWYAYNLPSGIYFCRLQTNNYSEIKKLVLQK
ncbi:MAG: two-component regulator propeller domain-containing protein [Melioribacteraceae bacterium]